MKTLIRRTLACLSVGLLASCASTPESRIKHDPALFNSFPPEAQAKIKKGDLDIGFTTDMVLMAKGKPDHKYARKTKDGDVEVWSYTGVRTTTNHQRVETRIHAPDSGGVWHYYNDWVWVDVPQEHEYEQFRIEIADGKVIAFESLSN